ncbi:MAG: mnmC [Rhizobacter sp.]|nr:mnmC [Rhizobacter sp.]
MWLQTGFGDGTTFIAIWRAWRADPNRCERLHVIAIDEAPIDRSSVDRKHPDAALILDGGEVSEHDLDQVDDLDRHGHPDHPEHIQHGKTDDDLQAQLSRAMPPLTPDLHRLSFDDGRVQLLIAVGAVAHWLPSIIARVDRFDVESRHVNGARPRTFKALARLANPQALLVVQGADIDSIDSDAKADAIHGSLRSAGFVIEPSSRPRPSTTHEIVARYDPPFMPRRAPTRLATSDALRPRHALIVGAGLAGCATAWALAEHGWTSTVIDRHVELAQETSGQHAGLFHGIVTPQDGAHARFNRAAALELARWVRRHDETGRAMGLLRLANDDVATMRRTLAALALPASYVQALDSATASTMSGLSLDTAAWFYPGGGWARPARLARSFFTAARASALHATVASLKRHGRTWQLVDDSGRVIAEADTVVWATAASMPSLGGADPFPIGRVRGQTTLLAVDTAGLVEPRLPIAGMGYALPAIDGWVMCGATVHDGDDEARLRGDDQRHNLDQLQRLTGSILSIDDVALSGRVGWRAVTADRLPIIGAWPDRDAIEKLKRQPDQPQEVPRLAGLYLITGFASRGITWSALAAQTLASLVTGAPCPLPADLLDAVDAGRFVAKASRRSS